MLVSCLSVLAWNLKSQVKSIFPSQQSSSKQELLAPNQGNEQKEGERLEYMHNILRARSTQDNNLEAWSSCKNSSVKQETDGWEHKEDTRKERVWKWENTRTQITSPRVSGKISRRDKNTRQVISNTYRSSAKEHKKMRKEWEKKRILVTTEQKRERTEV